MDTSTVPGITTASGAGLTGKFVARYLATTSASALGSATIELNNFSHPSGVYPGELAIRFESMAVRATALDQFLASTRGQLDRLASLGLGRGG